MSISSTFCLPGGYRGGLRVGRLGTSSVRYELALFGVGEEQARADGFFVHVFVDRQKQRPTVMPEPLRQALARLLTR